MLQLVLRQGLGPPPQLAGQVAEAVEGVFTSVALAAGAFTAASDSAILFGTRRGGQDVGLAISTMVWPSMLMTVVGSRAPS